jgi:hypothetical protein
MYILFVRSVFTAAEVARKLGIVRGSKEKASKSTTTAAASEVLILHCSRKNDGKLLLAVYWYYISEALQSFLSRMI